MAKKPKAKSDADTPAAGSADDAAKPGLFANKKLLLIVGGGGLAALLVLGGGAAWYFGLFGGSAPAQQTAQAGAAPAAEAARVVRPPHFLDIPEMTVNLSAGAQRTQFLRVRIALELQDQQVATQIQPLMPRVVDAFQTYLREMRSNDLEGSASLHRLREELTRRVNLAVQPARVEAVLFREILVQ